MFVVEWWKDFTPTSAGKPEEWLLLPLASPPFPSSSAFSFILKWYLCSCRGRGEDHSVVSTDRNIHQMIWNWFGMYSNIKGEYSGGLQLEREWWRIPPFGISAIRTLANNWNAMNRNSNGLNGYGSSHSFRPDWMDHWEKKENNRTFPAASHNPIDTWNWTNLNTNLSPVDANLIRT